MALCYKGLWKKILKSKSIFSPSLLTMLLSLTHSPSNIICVYSMSVNANLHSLTLSIPLCVFYSMVIIYWDGDAYKTENWKLYFSYIFSMSPAPSLFHHLSFPLFVYHRIGLMLRFDLFGDNKMRVCVCVVWMFLMAYETIANNIFMLLNGCLLL